MNQDILENEDIRYVSENEKSVDDPDRVGISEESASDLSAQMGKIVIALKRGLLLTKWKMIKSKCIPRLLK